MRRRWVVKKAAASALVLAVVKSGAWLRNVLRQLLLVDDRKEARPGSGGVGSLQQGCERGEAWLFHLDDNQLLGKEARTSCRLNTRCPLPRHGKVPSPAGSKR